MSKKANRSQDHNVSADQFIEVWMRHASSGEGSCETVAKELGLKADSVYQRAARTRKEIKAATGVELPVLQMSVNRKRTLDLSKLAALIDPTFGQKTDDQDGDQNDDQDGDGEEGDETSTGEIQDFVEVPQDEHAVAVESVESEGSLEIQ